MQIREMPAHERPQEKLLFSGAQGLSSAELLALVIRTGTRDKSALQLAEDVLAYVSANVGDLRRADARELMQIDGIGAAKACSVAAALELSRRMISWEVRESSPRLSNCSDAAGILMEDMISEKRELFMALFLDTRLRIESKMIVSIGSLDSAPVHPREVFGPAARRGAAAVIVAHNHPSGDPEPSQDDITLTRRLMQASEVMGIKLLDHIIIGGRRYVSLISDGYME